MTAIRIAACSAIAAVGLAGAAIAQDAPFGGEADVAYAGQLWKALEASNLVGANAVQSKPYEGIEPHGFVLQTFFSKATVDGHTGTVVVKRNYGPAGVEVDEVINNPKGHLGAVTVMYRREAGYDPDNADWYWAKYLPDGTLDKNPKGMQLAGRVAKGADVGCIACHSGADGDDYLFVTNAKLD